MFFNHQIRGTCSYGVVGMRGKMSCKIIETEIHQIGIILLLASHRQARFQPVYLLGGGSVAFNLFAPFLKGLIIF